MSFPRVLISSFVVLIFGSACISLPDVDSPQDDAGIPTSPSDSGHAPADGGGEPDASTPTHLTVTLLAPSATARTNDIVDVQVQVAGGTPEKVELLVDDQILTTLTSPYTYRWSTRPVAEGSHQLFARATLGSESFTSETREVVVDRTPPQVASRTPEPGAKDIWVRQPIEVSFSEPIKASTLTSDSVRLMAGTTDVPVTVSLSADGAKLSVTPSSRILVPNTVKLTLSAAITDSAGNPLNLPADAWSWSLPLSFPIGGLSALPGNTYAATPFLQLTRQGSPVVSWLETGEFSSSYWTIHVSTGMGLNWQSFGDSASSAASFQRTDVGIPQGLQLDQFDNPVIAWIHATESDKGGIYVKRWTGTAWLQLGDLLNAVPREAPDYYQTTPQALSMVLTGDGNPFIAWDQLDQGVGYSKIHVWRWTGTKWEALGAPLTRSWRLDEPTASANVSMVLDQMNRPIVAWTDVSHDETRSIEVHRWTGSNWEALEGRISAHPQPRAVNPALLLDAAGSPILAWSEFREDRSDVYVRRWTGNSWAPFGQPLSALPGKTSANHPKLQLSASGALFIAWAESSESGVFKTYIRRWDGSAWEEIGAPLDAIRGYQTSFTLDASGTPFLAWTYPDSGSIDSVRVHRYNH